MWNRPWCDVRGVPVKSYLIIRLDDRRRHQNAAKKPPKQPPEPVGIIRRRHDERETLQMQKR